GGTATPTLLEEQLNRRAPEVLDVQPAPPGEMGQPRTEPRWACEATGAARDRLAFGPDDGVAAERALLGHRPYPLLTGPRRDHRSDYFGDHVPRSPHHHLVADPNVLERDLVLVVEGGVGHVGSPDEHRLQYGVGSGGTGTANVDADVEQLGGSLLGRKLVGDGPAGGTGGETQQVLVTEVVDLHHHAIGLIRQIVPLGLGPGDVLLHTFQIGHHGGRWVDREPEVGQVCHRLGLGRQRRASLYHSRLVDPYPELARGRDAHVFHA